MNIELTRFENTISQSSVQRELNISNSVESSIKVPERLSGQQLKKQSEVDPGYQPTLQEKTIIEAIEKANQKMEGTNKEFRFSMHEKINRIMIKVVDTNTKQVIGEFPPEKIVDMVAEMCEKAGIFIDEKL